MLRWMRVWQRKLHKMSDASPTTFSLSVGEMDKARLLQHLQAQAISLNAYAERLFASDAFSTSTQAQTVQLRAVSLLELGMARGGTSAEIWARAATFGLELCPLEVAPHLRLHYRQQPQGAYLTVASATINDDEGSINGFYLRHLEDGLWLRGYHASDDYIWTPEEWTEANRFVFLVNRE